MDILSGGSDVYSRLQKINKIAAEQIKKEIENVCPNFEQDVNRVWEIIEKYLYGKDEELIEIKELKEKLNSIFSIIKNLKLRAPKTEINLEELQKPDYSTFFHYADLYGLEPYFLDEEPGKNKQKNSDEDFAESIISNVKYTKSCLKRAPVSGDEKELSLQIKELKILISETESEEITFELKSRLSELDGKLFAFKKEKASFQRNLDGISQKLESADLKKAETPLPLLEDSKSMIPNLEPLEEDEFEMCEIKFCDPSSDKKFNDEIYAYASNGKTIKDAPILHWTELSNPFFVPSKPLPRDILIQIKEIKNEDYNKWEYSSVYTKDEENNRRLCERFKNHFSNVFRDSEVKKVFKPQDGVFDEDANVDFCLRTDRGEINIDIDKMLQISPVFNPFYFIPIRDEKSGEIRDYKVGLKSLEQREREASMRGELKFWIEEDEFPRPTIYGWKSPKVEDIDQDEDEEDSMTSKPKEKKINKCDHEYLKEEVFKLLESIRDKPLVVDDEVTPSMKKANDILNSLSLQSGQVPFKSLDDLLDSLALDFNSQNLETERPDEKIPTQKWIEEAIDVNFENMKNFDTNEPLPSVSSKSIFQEMFSESDETEDYSKADTAESNTAKKEEFIQGSKVCEDENMKLLTEYESLHGKSGRGEIFTQHPNEKHETIDLDNTLESYESKYLTYPYYSTDVFQPDALLIRRLLRKIDGFQNLAVAKPEISLERQKEMLKTVRKDSDSAILEFKNLKDPSKFLNCKTIQKSIAEGEKLVEDFFNFASDDVLDEDFELDFDSDFKMPPNVKRVKLKVDAIEFDVEKLLDGFNFDSDCEEFKEDNEYAFKCVENDYKFAQTQEFDDWSVNSDDETDETDENTFTWAPLKFDEKFDAEKLLLKSLSLIDTPNMDHAKNRCEKFKTWIRENDEIGCEKLNRFIADSAKVNPHFFDGFDRVQNMPESEEDQEEEEEEEASRKLINREKIEAFKELGRAEEKSMEPPLIKLRKYQKNMLKNEFVEEIDTNIPVDISSIEMAFKYEFELDNFQKAAILALESHNHVFVSAHTSAGKTAVAEYAIAMARRNSTRVIYTSPIKALSNQKFYDFRKKFDHGENGISVGLITGDVQVNENARCLIMTTEILRSMIYNCPDKISDLEFVIFDEVHYLNDPDRGHVWEECIIILPNRVKIVMLSATVPNAREFSSWIGKTKKRKVVISSTHYRPVPLQHYLLDFRGKGPIEENSTLVKDRKSPLNLVKFNEHKNKQDAVKKKSGKKFDKPDKNRNNAERGEERKPSHTDNNWTNLIKSLKTSDKLPVVIFVFSRKKCDELASRCMVDLTNASEKEKIELFFKKHISSKLDGGDSQLPQVRDMKKLLLKGIGVHHSGILPILKEIVECLFGESIVKVLFATETFAMGVNMPARTVIFNRIEKFDKMGNRRLESDEYIQMAGRAGRRGKDLVGYVYIIFSEELEYNTLYSVMEGEPRALKSQFKIFYRTILNIYLKREHMSIKSLLNRSLLQNQRDPNLINIDYNYKQCLTLCKSLKDSLDGIVEIDAYKEFYEQIENYLSTFNKEALSRSVESGRLIRFTHRERVNKIGLVLCKYLVKNKQRLTVFFFEDKSFENLKPKTFNATDLWFRMISFFPFLEKDPIITDTSFKVLSLNIDDVFEVYDKVYHKFKKADISQINDHFKKLTIRPGTKGPEFVTDFACYLYQVIQGIEQSRMIDKLYLSSETVSEINSVDSLENFERFFNYQAEQKRLNDLREKISPDCNDKTFLAKRDVLYKRQFIDEKDEVLVKGQIASRISKFEIIVSEILFENILADLNPCEIASLLSCFVYERKDDETLLNFDDLPDKLVEAIGAVEKICDSIKASEKLNEVPQCDADDTEKISFKIAPIVYHWAKGMSFAEILELGDAEAFQEGIIVRFIIQLLEVLKEIEAAAKTMADGTMREKIQAATKAIKRGIVFAPSLYIHLESSSENKNNK